MRPTIAPRITAILAALSLISSAAAAQGGTPPRADAHTWRLGINGGVTMLRTPTQDATALPSAGAHLHIMANRTALLLGVDEIFGADEQSGLIRFNDVRRYQAVLLAHPFNKRMEPYFGVGGGFMQVVRPRVSSIVTDPDVRAQLQEGARDASTSGFATALVGVQGRWGRFTAFGQYQIGSAPSDDRLLRGVMHSVMGGIRINLGSSQDDLSRGRQ